MSAYAKLRIRRQQFVDAYVRLGVGKDAALAVGLSKKAPAVAASKLLANPEVLAAVNERRQEAIDRAGMRPVRMLEELALMALASNEDMRDPETKLVRTLKDLPANYLRASESIEFNADGSIKSVKLAKSRAINLSLQHLKLLTSVLEHQGAGGGPIETHEVSDLEKARRIAHLLEQGMRASTAPDPDNDSNGESGA